MPKKIKRVKRVSFQEVLIDLTKVIEKISTLHSDVTANKDKIASWVTGYVLIDLTTIHNRLAAVKQTIKGDQS